MEELKKEIPYYKEIHDFLYSIQFAYRTSDTNFYCLRGKENEGSFTNYKPPFRKGFYFIGLVSNAGKTKIIYDNNNVTKLNSFLAFNRPGSFIVSTGTTRLTAI